MEECYPSFYKLVITNYCQIKYKVVEFLNSWKLEICYHLLFLTESPDKRWDTKL